MEKFKSHNQLQLRCKELIENNEKVCQSIMDMADNMDYLVNFNLECDGLYKEDDEIDDNFNMWKVHRGERKYYD